MDRYRLGLSVERAGGERTLLTSQEEDARNVLRDVSFGTARPGGYAEMGATLLREIAHGGLTDLGKWDSLRLFGMGNQTAWEGQLVGLPSVTGADPEVTIEGSGWSEALTDDEGLNVLFVTQSTELWQELTLNQRATVLAGDDTLDADFTASADGGSLSFVSNDVKQTKAGSRACLMAIAPAGTQFTRFQYRGTSGGQIVKTTPRVLFATDIDSGAIASWDQYPITLDDTVREIILTHPRRFLMLMMRKEAPQETIDPAARYIYKRTALYGSTGVTTRASTDPLEPDGVLASECIAWALEQGAPMLVFTTEATSPRPTILPSTEFVIPEADFSEGASAEEILQAMNAYHQWDYYVWEGRRFYYEPPGTTGRVWRVRTDENATLNRAGAESIEDWTAVQVHYELPTGERKIVGPPSRWHRCDNTDASLEVTDTSNPLVALGRVRVKRLDLDFPTTLNGAIQIGQAWLGMAAKETLQGSIDIEGDVYDERGNPTPSWVVKANDRIVVEDLGTGELGLSDTDYGDGDVGCTLEAPSKRLEAYLARLSADTQTNWSKRKRKRRRG